MILLDTNVVSEMMKWQPARAVIDWLNNAEGGDLYLSSVTVGEIEYGIDVLPDGKRRDELRARFEDFLARAFAFRILAYDEEAARHYGSIMGARKRRGYPMSAPDGQIAAVARARGMTVATRNIDDFTNCGIEIVNPWEVDR